MNIPRVAKAREALLMLYGDALSSKRVVEVGNVIDSRTILTGVKCHLSTSTSHSVLEISEAAATAELKYILFVPVGTDIRLGDKLTVERKGQRFDGKAGQPIVGSFSIAVPLTEVKIA